MNSVTGSLDELRREIDSIDDALHDLIMRRAEVVRRIGQAKGPASGSPYRPAREAQLLRRLVGRHQGPLPASTVVRFWRELMAAALRQQGDFTVAVWRDGEDGVDTEMVRQHFGATTPLTPYSSPAQVITAIAQRHASVGVLPLPQDDDQDPWWPSLLIGGNRRTPGGEPPRIVARLPFLGPAGGRGNGAFVVARGDVDASGDDHSLIVLVCAENASRARMQGSLRDAGFAIAGHIALDRPGARERLHLLDLNGFVAAADPRFAIVGERVGATSVHRLGGYPTPMSVAN
ncbi:MAG: chorismate mutase [Alphaproteobacteria bacterium]|nr:chorismate mutase [Alphaproteobacteria bacterium]